MPRYQSRVYLALAKLKDNNILAAFLQWELIFTRLFCLLKEQKLAPCVRNWLYGIYKSQVYINIVMILILASE